jgi:F0F1-type ATP synthase membrane subunit b/b'
MENAFIEQFGIDWKLFLSQLINFVLILIILKFFVYNPVLKTLKERNKKIKEGLDDLKDETKEKFSKTKEELKDTVEELLSNSSYKAEEAITFLEEKLAELKKQNVKLQK